MLEQYYFYRLKGVNKKIKLDEILFLESAKNYTYFQAVDYFHVVRTPLDKVLNELPENHFGRFNRTFALSFKLIDEFDKENVWFETGHKMELTYYKKFYDEFMNKIKWLNAVETDAEQPEKDLRVSQLIDSPKATDTED